MKDPQGLPASKFQLSKVGFPIRKSTGHRLFAPHRSLSQRTTSFIASYRQGIHQMPLGHLIALISNAHLTLASRTIRGGPFLKLGLSADGHCFRKTRSHRDKPKPEPRSQLIAFQGSAGLASSTSRLIPSSRCKDLPPKRFGETLLSDARKFSGWWSQTGSNRRPQACKASALPTELWPPSDRLLHQRPILPQAQTPEGAGGPGKI